MSHPRLQFTAVLNSCRADYNLPLNTDVADSCLICDVRSSFLLESQLLNLLFLLTVCVTVKFKIPVLGTYLHVHFEMILQLGSKTEHFVTWLLVDCTMSLFHKGSKVVLIFSFSLKYLRLILETPLQLITGEKSKHFKFITFKNPWESIDMKFFSVVCF